MTGCQPNSRQTRAPCKMIFRTSTQEYSYQRTSRCTIIRRSRMQSIWKYLRKYVSHYTEIRTQDLSLGYSQVFNVRRTIIPGCVDRHLPRGLPGHNIICDVELRVLTCTFPIILPPLEQACRVYLSPFSSVPTALFVSLWGTQRNCCPQWCRLNVSHTTTSLTWRTLKLFTLIVTVVVYVWM